jgi:hypothetical protein
MLKLSLCFFLTQHHAMKAYGGVVVQLQAFFTSALDKVSGQLHVSAALLPGKEPLVYRILIFLNLIGLLTERSPHPWTSPTAVS